jgi:hypothetical protein
VSSTRCGEPLSKDEPVYVALHPVPAEHVDDEVCGAGAHAQPDPAGVTDAERREHRHRLPADQFRFEVRRAGRLPAG